MMLKIEKEEPELCRLTLSGRLDMAGLAEIEIEFAEKVGEGSRHMIVDMRDVQFMASLGMRMFLSAAKKLRTHQRRIVLLKPAPMVADSLRIAGFETLVPMADDEESLERILKQS